MPRRNYKTLRLAVVAVKSFPGNGHVLNKLESKIPTIDFYHEPNEYLAIFFSISMYNSHHCKTF